MLEQSSEREQGGQWSMVVQSGVSVAGLLTAVLLW